MLVLAGSSRQPVGSGNCLFPPAAHAPGTRSFPTEHNPQSVQSRIVYSVYVVDNSYYIHTHTRTHTYTCTRKRARTRYDTPITVLEECHGTVVLSSKTELHADKIVLRIVQSIAQLMHVRSHTFTVTLSDLDIHIVHINVYTHSYRNYASVLINYEHNATYKFCN